MTNIIFETTGLKPLQRFGIKDFDIDNGLFYLNERGTLWRQTPEGDREAPSSYLATILKYPNCIIRNISLVTKEHIELLKAAVQLHGAKWLAKDGICNSTYLYKDKPEKLYNVWGYGGGLTKLPHNTPLGELVSWSDDEPLNIQETLDYWEKYYK